MMLLRESIELNIREYMGLAETLVSIPGLKEAVRLLNVGLTIKLAGLYLKCWNMN